MGPLPLLAVAFLLGLLCPALLPPWASAALALLLAALGFLGRRHGAGLAALALLLAAACAGHARAPALRLPALTAIPSPPADRLRGRVIGACVSRARGDRCPLETAALGRVELHVPPHGCRVEPGDLVQVLATIRPIIPARNPPRTSPEMLRVLRGTRYRLDAHDCDRLGSAPTTMDRLRRAALHTRRALESSLARVLPGPSAARARALLFGDSAALDGDESEAFRLSGLAHLLAVSGAHVALLIVLLGRLTHLVAVRIRPLAERGLAHPLALALPLPLVGFFIVVTGESASSLRALLTALLGTLAALAGRRARSEAVLSAVAIGMAAVSPTLVLDAGWVLSIVASWALVRSQRRHAEDDPLPGLLRGVARVLGEGAGASVRVGLAVMPVLAWYWGRAPVTATAMNVIAAPVAEALLLPAVLSAAGAGLVLPAAIVRWPAQFVGALLDGLFVLPGLAMKLPLASVVLPVPTPAQCLLAIGVLLVVMRTGRRATLAWLAVGLLALGALEAAQRVTEHPRGVLRLTALDVGQGDALVVDLPDGTAMLVDGGGALHAGPDPGEREVVPWLALRRRHDLVAVVLSHPHPDHVGGLPAVLRRLRVRALWDTGQGEALHDQGAYRDLLAVARSRGVPVLRPEVLCGPPRPFHGAQLEVLAPCPGPGGSDRRNDGSFVMRLALGRSSLLLTGDIERAAEARLLDRLAPVSVLKVPHHGSRTSSTAVLLDRLRPRVALLSCGHPSPFGHPHAEVVARYAERGIPLRRTDLSGAVTVTLHPDGTIDAP